MNGQSAAFAEAASSENPTGQAPGGYTQAVRHRVEELLAAGQNSAALRLLETATHEAPLDEEAVTDLAVLYYVSKRLPDARALLAAFVAARPQSLLARKRLALLELLAGLATRALTTIEPVVASLPRDAEALRIVGDIAQSLKRIESAREFFQRSLAIDPHDTETIARLKALPPAPAPGLSGLAANTPARRFSGLLDLRAFFQNVPVPYAIVRLSPDFPNYAVNEDIDLICAQRDALRAHIRHIATRYEALGVRVQESEHDGHLHIDLFAPGEARLNFRFDILDTVASFRKVRVDGAWTQALLARCSTAKRAGIDLSVPDSQDELALRLLEYLEHRDARPDKVKHLHYVQRAGSSAFLAPLTQFTDLRLSVGNDAVGCKLDFSPPVSVARASSPEPSARPRVDYFLIWGHGLAHTREILEVIRAAPGFDILSIHKRDAGDMARFIQRVYECDSVPMQHLLAKTRYLLTVPSDVLLVVVRNHAPQEKYFGEGPFRHVQCERVKQIKEVVRDRFNPRAGDKRSEHHVIHASDYESQTEHVLRVMGLPLVAQFLKEPNAALLAPHHLPAFSHYRLREVPIASLRANILGAGSVPIEQTPHYQYALGNRQPYIDYQARYAGAQLTDDHYPEAFDRLIESYDPARDERGGKKSHVIAAAAQSGELLILDGVHRAALLTARGQQRLVVAEILPPNAAPGYSTPPTCQIPKLAELYQQHIGFKTDGVFVEVGAFDGEYVSNTSNLADLGWTGYYIEPVPAHVAACRQRHAKNPNTRVFEQAIAEKEGEATLHVGGVLSTMDPASLQLYETFDWAKGIHRGQTIQVQQTTLDHFLAAQDIQPGFDVLVIDVEGFEWNVLQGFSIERWRPRLAIVELHDENDNYVSIRESCRSVADYFRRNGYRPVFKDQTNTVFLRETRCG